MPRFRAIVAGTWPKGVHWLPDEVNDVPDDYPGLDGSGRLGLRPAWLVPVAGATAVEDTSGGGGGPAVGAGAPEASSERQEVGKPTGRGR